MNQAIVPAQLDGVAAMAWAWTLEFAPRLIAATLLLVVGLFLAGWVRNGLERVTRGNNRIDATIRRVLLTTAQYSIFVLVLILVLSQLGIQTTSLLAVLGAAGLAVGLALQGTLSNIAAGIVLLWLRPFGVGDYIEVNGMSGVVEETGLFACVLKTFDGAKLFAPNSTMWNFALKNHSQAPRRLLAIAVTVAGDARNTVVDVLLRTLGEDPNILADPPPDVFLDSINAGAAVFTCRFWTAHDAYGATQRSVVDLLSAKLSTAGISIDGIQMVTRVVPMPNDPTRYLDA